MCRVGNTDLMLNRDLGDKTFTFIFYKTNK